MTSARARRRASARRARRQGEIAAATLVAAAVVSAAIAGEGISPGTAVSFALALACTVATVAVTGVVAWSRTAGSIRAFAVSPFPLAAITWLVLFVLRPLELYFWPDHSAVALSALGFHLGDLTRTTAIAALGCATWCMGYLLALGKKTICLPRARPVDVSPRGAAAALAFGTLLWGALFVRQGGLSALLHAPASIRVNQGGSFYGFVGVWLVEGVTLAAFASMLQKPGGRAARAIFGAGLLSSLAASVCLQLRSLAAFGVLAGIVIFLTLRTPRRRTIAATGVVVAVAAVVLGATQQLRAYSATNSTRESIALTTQTPLWAMYVSDLSTFDNFVSMQELVPDSIPYLDGRTIVEIPLAFAPRSLWPDKPLGIDFEVSSYLYPGVFVAVPISVQGEFFWNGGLGLVALGALVLGLAFGVLARLGLGVAFVSMPFLLYAATLPFTHGLLTRGLATTIENLAFALVGVGIAAVATLPGEARALVASASRLRERSSWRPRRRLES